jgi:SAM-dependent methyltransferase
MDRTSRSVWRSAKVLGIFARREGFTDPGEERAIAAVAESARGRAILDIGVGGGRTVPILRSLSEDYTAVDYLPEMVELTRSAYPGVRVEQGDARDLGDFEDATFALVVFSLNGIDGLAHEDRREVLAAVKRVLAPGGAFLYSTHNLDHPAAGEPPWARCRLPGRITARPLAAWALRLPRRSVSFLRLRRLTMRREDWAVLVGASYGYGIVGHYVTLEAALRELAEAGYEAGVRVFGSAGDELRSGDDTRASEWFQLIARKPAGG